MIVLLKNFILIFISLELAIVCHTEYIEVTVERKNYPGLDTNVTHLEDEACVPGYRDEYKVVFRFGLEDCKTEQEEDKEAIHYKNKIVAVVKDEDKDGDITRSSTRVLPFQCSYKKKALVSKVRLTPRFTRVVTNAGNNKSTNNKKIKQQQQHSAKSELVRKQMSEFMSKRASGPSTSQRFF